MNGFKTYSQQIYATTATEVSEGDLVENSADAVTLNGLFAIVNSNVSSSGKLKLEFSSTVPANSTTYIKVDDLEKGMYDALLGGSLGDLLADATGTAALGDHYVEVSALDTTGEVVALGSTNNLFNDSTIPTNITVPLKVVKNKDGDLFITITPTVAYKAIVIKDITDTTFIATPNFTNVYHAFYLDPTDTSCNSEEIFTSFDGTGITLDLLDLGATGVKDLEFAIDNDPITFSTISVGVVSALASMSQDIYFSTTATNRDILELSTRPKGGAIVNAAYEQNITVELYKEDAVVFSQTLDAADQITIDPSEDGEIIKITVTPEVEFDRLRITLTSPVGFNLGQQVDLFSVKVSPPPPTVLEDPQYFCVVPEAKISDLKATSTGTLIWYDKATEGTAYKDNTALENGKKYYAANLTGTCESTGRAEVKVILKDPATTEGDENQSFCVVDEPTIADLAATGSGTVIWYDQQSGGTAYSALDALVNGSVYYAANFDGTCESSQRLEVTVTLSDTNTPEGDESQSFCVVNEQTIADLQATATGTIIWYNQPTEGTAYNNTDALINELKYYAANFDGTCESSQRLEVTVTLSDTNTPEGNANQNFCVIEQPTIADLQATTTGTIIWYNQPSEGTAHNNTDALEDGLKYYAANADETCESSERLEVTVIINDTLPVEITNANQSFCVVNEPTIADLQATATGTIIWYNKPSGGTAYNNTDTLVNELKYYAANSDENCESSQRLEVSVVINDIEPATIRSITQIFCEIENPTIADLKATGIVTGTINWYNQLTKGNAYNDTDALVNNLKYYAANSDGTCESSERLEVTVLISDTNSPSGEATQTFCSIEASTILDLRANTPGTITWYDQPTEGTVYANTDALANGFKYYAANSDGTCESSERLEVTVVITTAQDITIEGENANVCFTDIETYSVSEGHAPYTWNIAGGNLVSGGTADDNEIEIEWINITDAKVSVSLTGGCYSSNSAELIVDVVVCSDLTIKNEVDFIKPRVEDIITFTVDVKNSDQTIFTDLNISEVLTSGFIYISNTTTLGTYNALNGIWNIPSLGAIESATLTLTVKVNTHGDYLNTASIIKSTPIDADTSNNTAEALVTPSCLEIYNIITPNGDGMNDNFVISCIDTYIGADIEIYDRYGSIVYKKKNYNNDWNGVANQTSKLIGTGQKLPNGTYFFVIKFNDGSTENIKSYIQIRR
ncbi:gliding motility-associated C-terminal domain-containing protein [Polaribacter sp. SA4-10]|uniref:Ig-like domain-containing protein n=1 Tax=Polaribacter sp. SA4-10 TaxID=754397 RepID=UPI0018E044B2|nr:gliding motility-associated C-terminal domain-containing protein [Polaribacter sp. SA4-10]